MDDRGFDFQKFLNDTKDVLTSPKNYFTSMPKTGGLVDPVIRAAIYGFIAGILSFIWGFLHLTALWAYGGGVGITSIIVFPIIAVIGLFIGSVILLIISAICGGSTDFEANVRVTASLMALYPVQALFAFISGISFPLGAVVILLISLYGLWMCFNALVQALSAKESTAKIIMIIFAVFPILGLINTLARH